VVYRFIDEHKESFGLRWLCRHFGISLNCYYNYLADKKEDYHKQREAILERIKYIFYNNNRTVGHRAVRIFLKRYGIYLSKTTVHKYMNKDLGLGAVIMRKKPNYKRCKKHKIFDNLLKQNFNVNEKNKVWCTDFTYMRQPNGKFRYNCTIIDLYDRSVIASKNSDYINTELAIDTLEEALNKENHPKNLILHSDQGVQYTSWEFVAFCKDNGVTQSMSKAGYPYDNAPMERFYNTFKNCFYYRYTFESVEMLDEMTRRYMNWYNYVRPHSANGYLTPMEARSK
jgi:transposase InsO family protein